MREESFAGSVIHSAHTVGGSAGSPAPTAPQGSPHMVPER